MPINPTYSFTLIGSNSQKTTLNFQGVEISDVDTPTELAAAAAVLETLRNELNDVTDANVDAYSFSVAGTQTVGGVPADADVYEEAVLSLDITPSGEATKLASSRVPAPSIAIFQGTTGPTRDIVDVADADVSAWVAALAANVLISDGEAINSLVSGYRRTRRVRS